MCGIIPVIAVQLLEILAGSQTNRVVDGGTVATVFFVNQAEYTGVFLLKGFGDLCGIIFNQHFQLVHIGDQQGGKTLLQIILYIICSNRDRE